MAKAKQMLYTQEGYDALVEELNYLKNIRREEIKNDIAVARSFGDLSENAEYDEARNEQAKVEARIKDLEELIANAVIVDESKIDTSIVSVGSTVKVMDYDLDMEVEYTLVGSNEADPASGKISDQSPIGRALIGARAGQDISVLTPGGELKMKLLDVSRRSND
ncbi:MAG: transcription elongation factor GreA [Clostridia bacterium]|jgi:transcription elongation factor GreA|nr:transcription elongation factor GreA [Clostridia bacterium]